MSTDMTELKTLLATLPPLQAEDAIATLEKCYTEQHQLRSLQEDNSVLQQKLQQDEQTLAPHLERTKDLTKSSQTLDMLYLRTLVRVRDYLQRLQSQKEVESYLRATLNQTLARSVHLASSVTQLREQVEMVESVPVIQQRTKYRPCTTILLIPIVLASILVLPDALLAIMA